MIHRLRMLKLISGPVSVTALALALATWSGCKPPPPAAQPPASAAPATAGNASAPTMTPEATASKDTPPTNAEGLPTKVVENVEQLIKLTAEYNARAEKITDRQTYLDQSDSLSQLESELSDYVQYMEGIQSTLTPAQRATLDSKYFSRANPLIEAKRQHKMRFLSLLQ